MAKLSQTVEDMLSESYEDRMKAEYQQAVYRKNKLEKIVKGYKAKSLDFDISCPIELLEEQLDILKKYVNILKKRAEIEGVAIF